MESVNSSKVIVADDHPLFREALIHAVGKVLSDAAIIEAESLESLQEVVEANADADLLLLDLNMPGVSGFSALAWIRKNHAALPTIVVSAIDDPAVMRRSLRHAASGYIPKSSSISDIEAGIRAVLDGEVWLPDGVDADGGDLDAGEAGVAENLSTLTPHQFRVLMMLGEGLLNKQIAYKLGVSEATIKAHVTAILRKMGVTNRTQAVLAVQQLGVAEPALAEGDAG
ncbi:MAG: response regulator transcription factor [Pseudomonadota bacterium]